MSGKAYLNDMRKDDASGGRDEGPEDADRGTEGAELSSAEERKRKKEIEAEERRLRRKKESLEAEIEKLEEENRNLTAELEKPEVAADAGRLSEISSQMEKNKERLDECYEKWVELQEV